MCIAPWHLLASRRATHTPLCRSAHEAFYLRMLGVPVKEGEGAAAALKRLQASKVIAQMKNKAASHLVERLLLHAPASLYDALWVALKPHFAALCLNPVANFAMQSLIAAAPAARFVADMVPEVSEAFADVVLNHRSGVACVLLVAAACWRTGCEQLCTLVRKALPDGVRPAYSAYFPTHWPCSDAQLADFVSQCTLLRRAAYVRPARLTACTAATALYQGSQRVTPCGRVHECVTRSM